MAASVLNPPEPKLSDVNLFLLSNQSGRQNLKTFTFIDYTFLTSFVLVPKFYRCLYDFKKASSFFKVSLVQFFWMVYLVAKYQCILTIIITSVFSTLDLSV